MSKAEAKVDRVDRRAARQRAFLRVRLSYSDGAVVYESFVNQISASGAKIDFKDDVALPQRFRLEIPQKRIDCPVRLVWRDADCIAVAFEKAEAVLEISLAGLQERVRVLEAENKMLRAQCEALAAQIERGKASY